MREDRRDDFQAWLFSEILLVGLLGATLALFLAYPDTLRARWDLPQLRLVLQTTTALAGLLVALLAGVRFSVEGRRLDLLLCTGFLTTSVSSLGFTIAPTMGGEALKPSEGWAGICGSLAGQAMIAVAPFARGRTKAREG